jgi:transcriptional regulator with XRE-family HTH domain
MENYNSQSIDEIIGLRIRTRRKQLGITQKELADLLGVTFQQVQKYEGGRSRLNLPAFVKVCLSLRTSPSYFFDVLMFNDDVERVDGDLEDRLLAIFRSVSNTKVKARIVELVAAIAANLDVYSES